MDQADMQKIVRHLVNEERCGALALNARLRKVTLTEPAQLIVAQGLQTSRVAVPIATAWAPGQLARKGGDIGQLHRAFDLRMTRENLLDQR